VVENRHRAEKLRRPGSHALAAPKRHRADRQPHHRAAAGRGESAQPRPALGFIDYVPVGSLAKGKALVTGGGSGQTVPCAICHGASLKGAGRGAGHHRAPAIYVVRS